MSVIKTRIGRKIKYFRKERGLTQEKLAEHANIDYTTLNKIENSKRAASVETVAKIAKALKVSPKDLL